MSAWDIMLNSTATHMPQLIGDAYHGQGHSPSVIYNAKSLSPGAEREACRDFRNYLLDDHSLDSPFSEDVNIGYSKKYLSKVETQY